MDALVLKIKMDSEEDSSVLSSILNDVNGNDDDSNSTSFEYVENYDEEKKATPVILRFETKNSRVKELILKNFPMKTLQIMQIMMIIVASKNVYIGFNVHAALYYPLLLSGV